MSKGANTATTTLDPQLKEKYLQATSGIQSAAELPFVPFTGDRVANLTPDEMDMLSATRGQFQDSMSYNPRGMLAQMGSGPLDVSQYMNPYNDMVVQTSLNDLEQARQMQQNQAEDAAIKSKAFGGSREAILQAEANRDFANAAARTAADLRNRGFQTASDLAFQDRSYKTGVQGGLLSDQYRSMGLLGAGGQLQRGIQDRGYDSGYQEFGRMVDYPLRQAGLLSSSISGLPFEGTETSRKKTGLGDILGAGAGLFGSALMGGYFK
jgi:hypothetical protein